MYMSKENLPDLFNYVGYFNLFISFFSLLHPSTLSLSDFRSFFSFLSIKRTK